MHRLYVAGFTAFALTLALSAAAGRAAPPAPDAKSPATLADALEDWVRLLEKDDVKTAAQRWAADAEAAKVLAERWPQLKECHKDHNYRAWLDTPPQSKGPGAKQIGDATEFTVGGHSFGHHHVVWKKTDAGWRIANVWMCR